MNDNTSHSAPDRERAYRVLAKAPGRDVPKTNSRIPAILSILALVLAYIYVVFFKAVPALMFMHMSAVVAVVIAMTLFTIVVIAAISALYTWGKK